MTKYDINELVKALNDYGVIFKDKDGRNKLVYDAYVNTILGEKVIVLQGF